MYKFYTRWGISKSLNLFSQGSIIYFKKKVLSDPPRILNLHNYKHNVEASIFFSLCFLYNYFSIFLFQNRLAKPKNKPTDHPWNPNPTHFSSSSVDADYFSALCDIEEPFLNSNPNGTGKYEKNSEPNCPDHGRKQFFPSP